MSTILIVEDETYISQYVAINLNARGYQTLEATTVQAGLDLLRESSPHLILLDVKLADNVSGWSMLSAIADDPTLPKLPVILMTASLAPDQPDETEYPNLVSKLIKPFDVDDLVNVVSAIFG